LPRVPSSPSERCDSQYFWLQYVCDHDSILSRRSAIEIHATLEQSKLLNKPVGGYATIGIAFIRHLIVPAAGDGYIPTTVNACTKLAQEQSQKLDLSVPDTFLLFYANILRERWLNSKATACGSAPSILLLFVTDSIILSNGTRYTSEPVLRVSQSPAALVDEETILTEAAHCYKNTRSLTAMILVALLTVDELVELAVQKQALKHFIPSWAISLAGCCFGVIVVLFVIDWCILGKHGLRGSANKAAGGAGTKWKAGGIVSSVLAK